MATAPTVGHRAVRSVGVDEVELFERPRVSVIPTGEELVESDPGRGEAIETNGLTVTRYVERWGGDATYRDIVADDVDALRAAVSDDLDHDLVVTTGGSSVGERDLLPEVVSEIGEVLVHGVALKPGHPVALGVAEGTPISCFRGIRSPVSSTPSSSSGQRSGRPAIAGRPTRRRQGRTHAEDRQRAGDPNLRAGGTAR